MAWQTERINVRKNVAREEGGTREQGVKKEGTSHPVTRSAMAQEDYRGKDRKKPRVKRQMGEQQAKLKPGHS